MSGTHLIDGAFTMWYTDENKQDNSNNNNRAFLIAKNENAMT